MNRFIFCMLMVNITVFCSGCLNHPSTNSYTPENTFHKLVEHYPYISIAKPDFSSAVIEIKDINYVRYGDRELKLDLYLPALNIGAKRPAVLFIHGGGWRSGYRTNFTPFAVAMAKRGYAAATISYRLSEEALYPAAIHDAKAAVRWLRLNAEKYKIDADKIAVAGGSAGGQIASLVGVTAGLDKFDHQAAKSQISSDVQAIVNIDGLSDFTSAAARFYEDDPRKNPSAAGAWFGGRYNEKTEVWNEASPIFYVSENTPPMLFLLSSQERFSLGYAEMVARLTEKGIAHQVTKLPHTPHSFWLFDPWLQPSVEIVAQFLDKQFKVDAD